MFVEDELARISTGCWSIWGRSGWTASACRWVMAPGLTIEEALHRYREEQKTKQRLQSPKTH